MAKTATAFSIGSQSISSSVVKLDDKRRKTTVLSSKDKDSQPSSPMIDKNKSRSSLKQSPNPSVSSGVEKSRISRDASPDTIKEADRKSLKSAVALKRAKQKDDRESSAGKKNTRKSITPVPIAKKDANATITSKKTTSSNSKTATQVPSRSVYNKHQKSASTKSLKPNSDVMSTSQKTETATNNETKTETDVSRAKRQISRLTEESKITDRSSITQVQSIKGNIAHGTSL